MAIQIRVKLCMLIVLFHFALADIYLHNPRGSNNRLDGNKRNVRNNKRLCNTQNNNRGGNNVGDPMEYYVGSTLMVQWTNQHSCAGLNNDCELVLQYMCGDNVRDGTTTTEIPTANSGCANGDCNTDKQFGMHEDREYYQKCNRRLRNKGLFTADQDIDRNSRQYAKNTRQNAGGTRYGYECQEERDYYPYWGATPWIDIAVMTNKAERCETYQAESQNVKSRWECVITVKEGADKTMEQFYSSTRRDEAIPNTEELCSAFDVDGYDATWTEVSAHNKPAPECRETEPSRDNHNGNGLGGLQNVYNWTIPDDVNEHCVLRMRYNISTDDYNGWKTYSDTDLKLYDVYGFASADDAADRGYIYEGNPQVQIFPDYDTVLLNLAINTAQFGRTFQDRSHVFAIKSRPAVTLGKTIYNLNVRGKRGNLVQTYPSTEYDFVPNKIEAAVGDYIHIQWTGSDSNPGNNAGNGEKGTDRHNLILLSGGSDPNYGVLTENYVTSLDEKVFLGLLNDDGKKLAFPGDVEYFDMEPKELQETGTYNYVCTKNNDFTNRSQKGTMIVYPYLKIWKSIGRMGGEIETDDGSVSVSIPKGIFNKLMSIELKKMSPAEAKKLLTSLNVADSDFASDVVCLSPSSLVKNDEVIGKMNLKMNDNYDKGDVDVKWSKTGDQDTWILINGEFENDEASFDIKNGGCYFVQNESNSRRNLLLALLRELRKENMESAKK